MLCGVFRKRHLCVFFGFLVFYGMRLGIVVGVRLGEQERFYMRKIGNLMGDLCKSTSCSFDARAWCLAWHASECTCITLRLEAMESHEFVFGRPMGEWRMRLDILSIVLLTLSLSHHRPYAQGGQPRRRRYCGKSKPDRHGGREGGKLEDSTLTVARYNAPALRPPIALLISSGNSDS